MTTNQIALQNLYEMRRSNLAKEAETARSNVTKESISREELAEAKRHNKEMEVVAGVREGANIVSTIFSSVGNIGKALF